MHWIGGGAALAVVLATGAAHAQAPAAEALFEQGRAALAAGDLDTACARFRASDQLDPGAGVRANLGMCEEKRGRLASAWEAFREALKKLPAGDERLAKIQARIDALEPRLPRLKITLAPNAPKDTRVREGDAVVGSPATFGIALPFDPGPHRFTLTAEGYPPRVLKITLKEGKETALVVDPTLPAKGAPPATAPAADADGPPSAGPWIIGGIGAAGLVAGAITGALVLVNRSTVSAKCNDPTATCASQSGITAANTVRTLGPVTTATLVAGGAGVLAGGLWLGLRSPSKTGARVGVGPIIGGAACRVEGAW